MNARLCRYHDGGRLSDQQMALLQYQRENLHYLSEEVMPHQRILHLSWPCNAASHGHIMLLLADNCWLGNSKSGLR